MSAIVIPAKSLRVGDFVHRGNHSMRVVSIDHADRTTRWLGQYTRCEFAPERVGRMHQNVTRKTTLLTVSRVEPTTMRSDVVEVLRDHEWRPDALGCACGSGAVNIDQHREHVADELATIVDYWTAGDEG